MQPPSYFSAVRAESASRWHTLEADPTLAAPWHQLFSQVQSPRHVVSELLQNADDSGATEVDVELNERHFAFTHNGADFNSDQFQSLCRFGFSNKRTLHTIGFRGVGFKSVFSVGSRVCVATPSLKFGFNRDRFTLPEWDESIDSPGGLCTRISVCIDDNHRQKELSKNLDEWKASPTSLIFFRNIQKFTINGFPLERRSVGEGPIPNSTWIDLHGQRVSRLLHIHSPEVPFPEDSILEISRERMADKLDLPPCRVEIVLGIAGDQRLFVVLPTAVKPLLPFSCNAPFVQDPARMAIKDPSVSPTNRWLTQRIGDLAAEAMLGWLDNSTLPMATRSRAYELLCPTETGHESVAASVTSCVTEAFASRVKSRSVLLTTSGELRLPMEAVAVPERLHRIWSTPQICELFGDSRSSSVLAPEVSTRHVSWLLGWGWVRRVTSSDVIEVARRSVLPRPESLHGIAEWWLFTEEVRSQSYRYVDQSIPLVPVRGEEVLFKPNDVVRLPQRPTSLRQEDWTAITERCMAIDPEWIDATSRDANIAGLTPEHAREIFQRYQLDKSTSVSEIVGQAFDDLLEEESVSIAEMVWFAHVLAAMNASVPENFQFVTKDCFRRDLSDGLLADNSSLEFLAPDEWLSERLIHDDYSVASSTCSHEKWISWLKSDKSGLGSFSPLKTTQTNLLSRDSLIRFCANRGAESPKTFQLKASTFVVSDFDFDATLLRYWNEAVDSGEITWRDVLVGMAGDSSRGWESSLNASVVERGTTKTYPMYGLKIPAGWVIRLRDKRCLPDTRGELRVPAELLRRTPDTEPLMGVEPFVDAELDVERNVPLLDLLGVRSSPASPHSVVDRLRALSQSDNPPVQEVRKWYDAIDRMLYRHRPDDLQELRESFAAERLIWSEDHGWVCSTEVFRACRADDPEGFPVVHSAYADLAMWRQLGVQDSPTPDLLLQHVREWEAGRRLSGRDLATVRSIIPAYAIVLWNDLGRWPTLDGQWTPTRQIENVLYGESGVRARELSPAIKRKTADCQGLPESVRSALSHVALRDLGTSIELRRSRTQADLPAPESKGWMRALGSALGRIKLPDLDEQARIRQVGIRLATTRWQSFTVMEITPYLDGIPAGQSQQPDALWEDRTIFVRKVSPAKSMDAVVIEICRQLPGEAYLRLLRSCYERDESFVADYVSDQLDLADAVETPVLVPKVATPPQSGNGTIDQPGGPFPPKLASLEEGESVGDPQAAGAAVKPVQQGHFATVLDSEHGGEDTGDTSRSTDGSALPEDHLKVIESTVGHSGPIQRPSEHERRSRDDNPPFIARYAVENNFQWDPREKAYTRIDGMRLCKSQPPFNWEYWDQIRMRCRYVVCEQSLTDSGVEIASDAWELIRKYPGSTGLIFRGEDGRPTPISGGDLVRMVQGEALTLFPFKYRLRKT